MEIFDVYLTAGNQELVPREGAYFRILEASAPVVVHTDTGVNSVIFQGIGADLREAETGRGFSWLRLKSEQAQVIKVAVSAYPITDDRLLGTVDARLQAKARLNGLPVLSFATAGAAVVAGNVARYRLDLYADDDNPGPVWIGAKQAGAGIPLPPGGVYQVEIVGDLDLFAEVGGSKVYAAEVV